MCLSTSIPAQPPATPMPTAAPQAITTTVDASGQMLNQYAEAQRRRGIQSTVRGNQPASSTGLTTGGSAQNTTLG